jgi:hypothetical protein
MRKLSIAFILPWIAFLIPINIYIAGAWMAVGTQWALFRYILSYQGTSIISLGNEVDYIYSGLLLPKSFFSTLLWLFAAGALLLSICFLLKDFQKQAKNPYKIPGAMIMVSGFLFLAADMVQYGLVLFSKNSICIPIGIPVLLLIGFWEYRYATDEAPDTTQVNDQPFFKGALGLKKRLSVYAESPVFQELAVLIFISVFIYYIVFTLSFFSSYELRRSDVKIFYDYVSLVLAGKVPYYHFGVEYPQFFFIPALLAALPTLLVQNFTVYSWTFQALMYIFDIATLVCVYLIALRLFGQPRAFLCGLLCSTAFSAIFFIPLTYDIFPTFLVMLSLLLLIYGNECAAYLSATAGALAKWFPVFCLPFFFIYSLKSKQSLRPAYRGILFSLVLVAVSIVPLYLLNPAVFLGTYSTQLNRDPDPHSIIYYLDIVSGSLFNLQPFSGYSFLLLLAGECALIFWYYQYLNEKQVTLCISVFLGIFFFMLINKIGTPTYIVWITPFLALFLINSYKEIILFYLVQLLVYAEAPMFLGIVYAEAKGYTIIENSQPSVSFLFYTVKFAILGFVFLYILWRCKNECTQNNKNAGTYQK